MCSYFNRGLRRLSWAAKCWSHWACWVYFTSSAAESVSLDGWLQIDCTSIRHHCTMNWKSMPVWFRPKIISGRNGTSTFSCRPISTYRKRRTFPSMHSPCANPIWSTCLTTLSISGCSILPLVHCSSTWLPNFTTSCSPPVKRSI